MARNNEDFHQSTGNSEYKFSFVPGNASFNADNTRHEIQAHDAEGNQVGSLQWNSVWEGSIHDVYVSPKHRRKGLATKMLEMAKATGTPIEHSRFRTKEGEKWAASTGDNLPKLENWERK